MQLIESTNRSRSGLTEALATGRILIEAKIITQSQLDISLKQQQMYMAQGQPMFIEQIILMNRFASNDEISSALSNDSSSGKRALFETILPLAVCERYKVLPLRVLNNVLELKTCKMLTPANEAAIMKACLEPVEKLRIFPADLVEISEAHKNLSSGEFSFEQMLAYMRTKEITGSVLRQAINAMLIEAIEMRASDLRLDRKPDPDAWASHRVDGVVRQTHLIPAKTMAAIFTRLKNDCGMDASDNRRAQDGRISVPYKGRQIDFRVNTLPVDSGESMSLRILDADSVPGLETLFPNQPDMTEMFKKISQVKGKQGGIILFSGPTGSGKTTSLYSLTQRFPRDQMNVMTVEDPIEYKLLFTRQVQRNQGLAQKMSDVERAMLRQDPDVLVLGEIRDADSMKTALHFAESGHLVVATIHSNSAEETLGRILSLIGGEGKSDALYMLANTLRLIINQQLAPRLCSCATTAPASVAAELLSKSSKTRIKLDPNTVFKQKKGCSKCLNTGYYNRVAAHETLIIPMDHALRSKLAKMMFESMSNFSEIRAMDGVIYKSRENTFEKLIEGGVCDLESALLTIAQEYT